VSGSPKYSVVYLGQERSAAERAARAARVAQRRNRQAERVREFHRREAERAARARDADRAMVTARLGSVRELLTQLGPADGAGTAAVAAAITALEASVRGAAEPQECLREVEDLRARTLALRPVGRAGADPDSRQRVLSDLRSRIAAQQEAASGLEAHRHARCVELIDGLQAAAAQPHSIRFEALHGTAEHEVSSYILHSTEAARLARETLAKAAGRLGAVRPSVAEALADAADFGEHELRDRLAAALDAAVRAQSAAETDLSLAGTALTEVTGLEQVLAQAESRLDESQAAHARRAGLADALKAQMVGQGMSFLGGADADGRFLLHFERPSGAVYTTAVDDGEQDGLVVSYAILGEDDIPVQPGPGQAVCDQTEEFLSAVHASLAAAGYQAGELQWEGKPATGAAVYRARQARSDPARMRRHREAR
jgi:hypothetical protein